MSWRSLGEPDPFVVVEAGAGSGRLAVDVLRAAPACTPALRYVLVERSTSLRALQRELLTVEPADEALGPFAHSPADEDALEPVTDAGPIVTQLDELPAVVIDGVVLANELVDNLPVRLVERTGDHWSEVRVGSDDGRFVEVLVAASATLAAEADAVAPGDSLADGTRVPVPVDLRSWLERAAALLRRGDIVLIDYADVARSLAARGHRRWLRTYRTHGRGTDPLDAPGEQDITCDVPVEYLLTTATRVGLRPEDPITQADWLRALGIDELVDEGAAIWRTRAHLGRSRGDRRSQPCARGRGAHRSLRARSAPGLCPASRLRHRG